jgi:hypothetical protein
VPVRVERSRAWPGPTLAAMVPRRSSGGSLVGGELQDGSEGAPTGDGYRTISFERATRELCIEGRAQSRLQAVDLGRPAFGARRSARLMASAECGTHTSGGGNIVALLGITAFSQAALEH